MLSAHYFSYSTIVCLIIHDQNLHQPRALKAASVQNFFRTRARAGSVAKEKGGRIQEFSNSFSSFQYPAARDTALSREKVELHLDSSASSSTPSPDPKDRWRA